MDPTRAPGSYHAEDEACVEGHGCEIAELFRVLGKTHMLAILHYLCREVDGPVRFVDIQNRLSLSPNTLSARLKELTKAGLITRTAYNQIPPRVDYEGTPKAYDLRIVFEALHEWADRHDLNPVEAQGSPEPELAAAGSE